MAAFVVDVNVGVAANGGSPQADTTCQLACIRALREVRRGVICPDKQDHILEEYRRHLSMSGQPDPGDEFMYWVFQNQCNADRCETVSITPHHMRGFVEFPDNPELAAFDRDDRKYVAVALGSRNNPAIMNAVDSDWLHFESELAAAGVHVRQLCPDCLKENGNG